jgi:hypothetical protein
MSPGDREDAAVAVDADPLPGLDALGSVAGPDHGGREK